MNYYLAPVRDQAQLQRDNLERLLASYEASIRWHEAAIKRHNAEVARLNQAHAEACHKI